MKIVFDQNEINGYLKESKEHFHPFYDETVKIAESMAVHADGKYPEKLIDERRPNEPIEVKDYRKIVWTAKTKPTFSKVYSELQKIRRSSDWMISYDISGFTRIRPEETIEQYSEYNFPGFTSITNWCFSLLLRKYLIDPNAVCFVRPETFDIAETDFYKPFPEIYDSVDVLDFVPGDYAVLRNKDGAEYLHKGKKQIGKSYIIITTQDIIQYDQINFKGDFQLASQRPHGLTILPVFSLGGVMIDQSGGRYLYESRISGMIPELDEAVREYSDLQASKVMHIYAERWEYTQNECTNCKGTGRISNPACYDGCDASIPTHISCDNKNCYNGYVVSGPYSKILVRPTSAMDGGAQIPTPPAGYIEKDVEIVKVQEESVQKHIYEALSAINFEFLANTPLNQSGTAKEVDQEALNNTVHSIAEDLVRCMDNTYLLIALYRYSEVYSVEEIKKMVPKIPVPEKYDFLAYSRTLTELGKSKTDKINPVIISALEEDYAAKRFNSDPEVRDAVALSLRLDPLPNISEDDKMSRLTNKGITLESYVISSNIQEFIRRAMEEDKNFHKATIQAQRSKLSQYAKEVIASNGVGSSIISEIAGDENIVSQGGNALKESVGGLTGMIEIAKAVASGLYDLDAAVALVADRFGISEEMARKQLGTPNIQNTDSAIEKVAQLT